MKKRYTFTFPDGTVISGFQWSIMGWYYRRFPPSGIHSEPFNDLQFTRFAIIEHGITVEEE